ncbi:hypothetical protein HDF16_005575 [Granulicella aggregans]|uniref:Uncharacterized protein n=1 Tax=Granulicella aggregans TaxID=474949 RepID=A0A7W7ZJQ8_9BACT|nr:hypothetical protein [Granulicella aggregans]
MNRHHDGLATNALVESLNETFWAECLDAY